MRENGGMPRERDDVPAGACAQQQVNFHRIMDRLNMFFPGSNAKLEYLTQCHRLIFHIRQVMIVPNVAYDTAVGLQHRIRYMLGDFSEKQWLSKIKAREKLRDVRKCQSLLFTMCANTLEDLLNNISMCRSEEEFLNYYGQLQALNKYITDNILQLKKRFKVRMPSFDSVWNLIYV
jgi:hypothetical protein